MGCSCGKHVFLAHVFWGAWAGVCEIVGCDVVIKDLQGAGPLAGLETCVPRGFVRGVVEGGIWWGRVGGWVFGGWFFFGVGKVVEYCRVVV
jgi:hypothetical protein